MLYVLHVIGLIVFVILVIFNFGFEDRSYVLIVEGECLFCKYRHIDPYTNNIMAHRINLKLA